MTLIGKQAFLLACLVVIGLFLGCVSTEGVMGDTSALEPIEKYYLIGTVDTENEGLKEYDCSHKILGCRDDYEGGERILACLADTPEGTLKITGGVKSNTLEKHLC